MSNKSTQPRSNAEVAKRVITPKQRYFVPDAGGEVEATDLDDLANKLKKQRKAREAGDGNN